MSRKVNTKQLFPDILKKGKVFHSPHISAKVLFISNVGKSAFYFVVSGKIIKKAVKRNLFKRRGRHITRSTNVKDDYIGVFFAKKGAGMLDYSDYKEEVIDLLKKADLLTK